MSNHRLTNCSRQLPIYNNRMLNGKRLLAVLTVWILAGCGDSTGWSQGSNSSSGDKSGKAADALTAYRERMKHEQSVHLTDSAQPDRDTTPATPSNDRRVVAADTLEVLDQFITPDQVLDPIRPQLTAWSREMPPSRYVDAAAELVRESLVEQVANHLIYRRASAQVTPEMETQIDLAVDKMERERIGREFDGRETAYANALVQSGRKRDEVRAQLRRGLIVETYLRDRLAPMIPDPTRKQIRRYYDSNREQFTTEEQRQLLMIDIPAAAFLDRSRVMDRNQAIALARRQARATAQEAKAALRAGRPFADVARQYSKFKAEDGGDWGIIREPLAGRWEKPSKRFFELPRGGVSEIIETEDSFFIVKCGEVTGGVTTPFVEAQPVIVNRIKSQKFRELKAEFLQNELNQANIGEIDAFYRRVLQQIPQPSLAGR